MPNTWKCQFGVKKGLLIEKSPTEKMGDLIFKFILRTVKVETSFCQGKGKWKGREVIDNHRQLGAKEDCAS